MKDLITELELIAAQVDTEFGSLSEEALNWKPGADIWSVGQCLDHLVVTNRKEIPAIERAANGVHTSTFWERLPVLPGFLGSFLLKAVDPDQVKKHTAPKVFQPSKSAISTDIVDDYKKVSEEIRGFMKAFENKDTAKMIITSPVAKFATYSLENAFKIIVLHDRRHCNQAMRVMETAGFPK